MLFDSIEANFGEIKEFLSSFFRDEPSYKWPWIMKIVHQMRPLPLGL